MNEEMKRRIERLPPEKRALFQEQLQRKAQGKAPGGGISPRPAGESPALSSAQQRLWFLDQLEPGLAAYNIPAALRLTGALDVDALRRAVSEIVARHEALRSGFVRASGKPAAVLAEPMELPLPRVKIATLPEGEREAEARRLAAALAAQPFDLAQPPLLRLLLIETGERAAVLALSFHHIVFDGWSVAVFVRELATLYGTFVAGKPSPLPALPIQYGDFAAWQRDRLQGEALAAHLVAWKARLAGMPGRLDLPADRPRPAAQSYRGVQVPFRLARPVCDRLKALCDAADATLFMALTAGFQAVLHRWSGQEGFGVATFTAGRTRPETEGLIGFFINTLILRADLAGDPTFRELLDRVRTVTTEAFEHQELPFERLVEELRVERDPACPPLAQVALVLQNTPASALELPGLAIAPFPFDLATSKLDLLLSLTEGPDGLSGPLEIDTALFDRATAERLLDQLAAFLAAAAEAPDRRLSELAVPTAEELYLLHAWNETGGGQTDISLHQLFEQQAARTPDAVALIAGRERLTYRELDERAERLAAALRARGVGPETRVAVYLERTPDLIAALLGVLKAGGAYVPIDPAYPRERSAFLLRDSRAALAVTDARLASLLGDDLPVLLVNGPAAPGAGSRHPESEPCELEGSGGEEGPPSQILRLVPRLRMTAEAGDLAYLIYTSGSTGTPKGVAIEHGSAAAMVAWARSAFSSAELACVLAGTSVCFDLSVFEIFAPLACGGAVVLARQALELAELPAAGEVTLLNTVPSAAAALLRLGGLPASLRAVNLAGEPLRGELVERLRAAAPGARVLNLYGPSECTTYSTWDEVGAGEEPSIGRPVAGTRAWVLDRGLRPVPLGARGLLFLAGDGVARGYEGRPDLTAERFLPDPFAVRPGERMYATGDLVRQRADGRFDFLGRADRQVKVRGVRIELGEVEAALLSHPGVSEAVAAARSSSEGETRLVAWIAPAPGHDPSADELRRHLRERLPAAYVPSAVVRLAALPLTPNGKVDHAALPAPESGKEAQSAAVSLAAMAGITPRNRLERAIAQVWQEVLGREVGAHDNFFDIGGHSLLLVEVHEKLRRHPEAPAGRELALLDLFRSPTVASLAAVWGGAQEAESAARPRRRALPGNGESCDIAVVGLAVRVPDAADPETFWRNLRGGVESRRTFSDEELLAAGVSPELIHHPDFVRSHPYLDGIELFDAPFFGFNPLEASLMDPQHRIFLECAWAALEDAGCDAARFPGRIGVFGGAGMNTYLFANLLSNGDLLERVGGFQTTLGNDKDYVSSRVAYELDLKGPAVTVQTACSTSLVAVHMACRSLADGDCDAALAGGVSVRVPQTDGYLYMEGERHSPDGRCRPFDAAASGTVGGSGAALVVLKRLADALADGDTIRAVIKGSAINNDGSLKIGYTAPSTEGQAEVIADALELAGVGPETIDYVEAHGTATPLGDPIEASALARVFGQTKREPPLAIGSVKSNIGHLDSAAGVAGLAKVVLALENRELPPSLHFETPNPKLDLAGGKIAVQDRLESWPRPADRPRRAGVSAFGVGGTNVHMIVEEAPVTAQGSPARPGLLLPLSAKTPEGLETMTRRLAEHLGRHPETALEDVAYTLQAGRKQLGQRRFAVLGEGEGQGAAIDALLSLDPKRVLTGTATETERPVFFLFPGQGTGYAGMARQLYESEPVFRAEIDRCAELAAPLLAHEGSPDLRRWLFPTPEDAEEAARRLDSIETGQPALFIVEWALACLWMDWGVRPQAMIGHSVGELTAACVAGVFTLEEGLRLVVERARLMGSLPTGAMLHVPLPEEAVLPLLETEAGRLSLAAVNGPAQCLVSGPEAAVEALAGRLRGEGVEVRRLRVDVAGHSWMNEAIVPLFAAEVEKARPRAPRIPYLTNLTGTWVTPEEATDPWHWARHLACPVRFAGGLEELCAQADAVLLEVGPGRSLANLVRQAPSGAGRMVVPSLPHPSDPQPDRPFVLHSLGRLWLAGAPVDWQRFAAPEQRRRVPLPTYPFERLRCWIDARPQIGQQTGQAGPGRRAVAPARRAAASEWLYAPSWRRTPPVSGGELPEGLILLFAAPGLGQAVAARLRAAGREVAVVEPNGMWAQTGPQHFRLDPSDQAGYGRLLDALGETPSAVLHLWSLTASGGASFEEMQDLGFYSLLYLARAFAERNVTRPVRIVAAASGLHEVVGGEPLRPEASTLLGPCAVIPQEHPNLSCRAVDVLVAGSAQWGKAADALIAELALDPEKAEPVVAWRNGHRWARDFAPLPAAQTAAAGGLRLRAGGTYLITGGLGRVGLVVAEHLARTVGARVVLCGRTPVPPRAEWETSPRFRRLLDLEALGAEVLPLCADVADPVALAAAVAAAREHFGRIDGVLHAAGIVGEGSLVSVQASGWAECAPQMRVKVQGMLALERVFAKEPPDFFLLFSSLAAFLGGLGYAAYAGANACLDAWAQELSRQGGAPWVSVDWEAWRFEETGKNALARQVEQLAITPEEGSRVLDLLFGGVPALPQVVVSTSDPQARLADWKRREAPAAGETSASGPAHARPNLHVAYVAPRNEAEEMVAAVWRELLGLQEIGVHDDFFELGGHSVLATQLVARLRQTLGTEVRLESFFRDPTIAGLAASVQARPEDDAARRLEEILREVEGLTDEADGSIADLVGGLV